MRLVAGVAISMALVATPTQAAVERLPVQRERVSAAAGGCADTAYRAAGHTGLRATLAGARGDWDLLLLDRAARKLDGSRGLAANEVVQARLAPGQRVTVRACRRNRGASRAATIALDAVALPRPARPEVAQLLRVRLVDETAGDRLQALGLDLGEDGASGWLSVVANGAADVAKVRSTGLPFRVQIPDLAARDRLERSIEGRAAAARGATTVPSGRTAYRTFDGLQQELKDLAAAHPERTRLFNLDLKTSQGRDIPAIELADDVALAARDGRPTFVVVALHHAREWPAAEIAMEFVHDLLGDAGAAALLERSRIVVVPVQNPDGYVVSRTGFEIEPDGTSGDETAMSLLGGVQAYRRKTCSGPLPAAAPCDLQPGADSNRNYGANWGASGSSTHPYEQDYRGAGPWSEPETEAIHRLLQRTNATLVLSLHNVLGAVLRPPGTRYAPAPYDEEALAALGEEVAQIAGYREATFFAGLGYDGSGITEDWAYDQLGAFTYTIEVGPSGGQFHANYPAAVERQWVGDGVNGGMRGALRRLAEAAIDPALHAVLEGSAPAGATLRVSKTFQAQTGAPCTFAPGILVRNLVSPLRCVQPGQRLALQDEVRFEAEVPAAGRFRFHVPPSTRPMVESEGGEEAFVVECMRGGAVAGAVTAVARRGAITAVQPDCG